MAHATVFMKTNIRDTRAKEFIGKDLVYGFGRAKVPGNLTMEEKGEHFLVMHYFIWDTQLTPDEKRLVTPKWFSNTVKLIAPFRQTETQELDDFSGWKPTLDKARKLLGAKVFKMSKREIRIETQEAEVKAKADPALLNACIVAHETERVLVKRQLSRFPDWNEPKSDELLKAGLRELLNTGTVFNTVDTETGKIIEVKEGSKGRKEAKPVWQAYLDTLTERQKAAAAEQVDSVQTLRRNGRIFEDWCKEKGLTRIDAIMESDIQSFITWRASKKKSFSDVSKMLTFVGRLFRYAKGQKLIDLYPVGEIDLLVEEPEDTVRQTPFTIAELLALLQVAKDRYEETEYHYTREQTRKGVKTGVLLPLTGKVEEDATKERKVNWYTLIFLAVTGARPSEAGKITPGSTTLTLNAPMARDKEEKVKTKGKTSKALRSIELYPVLRTILEDKDFLASNQKPGAIAGRLRQFVKRTQTARIREGLGENESPSILHPYRFRKTAASIMWACGNEIGSSKHISYLLGHSSESFTASVYVTAHHYKKDGEWTEKQLTKFWQWLTEDYFTKPGKIESDFH